MCNRKKSSLSQGNRGFTVLELLIVIAILAVLVGVVVISINPVEIMRKSRDAKRLEDIASIDNVLVIAKSLNASLDFGESNTIYISLPDTDSGCNNLTLPALPDGWNYGCVAEENLRKTNGTGWVPVNFQDPYVGGSVGLSSLPVDPLNQLESEYFYTYTPGSWILTAKLEATDNELRLVNDGGPNDSRYERGSDINLLVGTYYGQAESEEEDIFSASNSSVSVDPGIVDADGTSVSTITITVKNTNNDPIQGKTVTLASTGSGNTITQPSFVTNSNGQTTGTIASTEAEEKTITATVSGEGDISQKPTVTFIPDNWYEQNWTYRVKVTVLASEVDADLSNFPVYVDLSDLPAGFHAHVNQTDARDIRVTESDGETKVPREVVFYDAATDTGELHFKGNIDGDDNTDFYIYYSNSNATEPATDSTYGAENVWDSYYKAVYHLQEDPSGYAPQNLDSSSNANHLTSGGSMSSNDSVAVKIGKGIDFDGSDDELLSANNIGITGAGTRTISMWVKQPTAANKNFLGFGVNGTGQIFDLLFYGNKFIVHCYGGGNDNISGAPSYTANTLAQVYATYDGTAVNSFVNGNAGTPKNMALNTIASVLRVGKGTYNVYDRFTGQMDEVRVSNVVRSTTWMSTEYNNQSSPSTFYSVGNEEGI